MIGRLILMYLPDPAATLLRLAGFLRPVASSHSRNWRCHPPAASPNDRCSANAAADIDTIDRAGFEIDMGGKLPMTFAAAGLPAPQMNAAGLAGAGPDSPVYDYIAGTLRSLLPMAEAVGVATAAEMNVDRLAERLRAEAVERQACFMLPLLVGAWSNTPS